MNPLRSRTAWVWIGFLLIGGYFLWAEHTAHLALAVPYLPYLLLLACPLLHVFMHGGHGHGDDSKVDPSDEQQSRAREIPEAARVPMTGGRDG